MDMTLTRTRNREDGIFGTLKSNDLSFKCVTLEHAYMDPVKGALPKLQPGTYTCVRGPHRLHNMTSDFITFEITGVPGHTNILFHWGNYNKDSEGCVLLGDTVAANDVGEGMVTCSRLTYSEFMKAQKGIDKFILTVI